MLLKMNARHIKCKECEYAKYDGIFHKRCICTKERNLPIKMGYFGNNCLKRQKKEKQQYFSCSDCPYSELKNGGRNLLLHGYKCAIDGINYGIPGRKCNKKHVKLKKK